MTAVRQCVADDLFRLGRVNLDAFTETYHLGFYFHYMVQWPHEWDVAVAAGAGDGVGWTPSADEASPSSSSSSAAAAAAAGAAARGDGPLLRTYGGLGRVATEEGVWCASQEPAVMAYNIGKSEGEDEEWHEHITAVTVAPEYRRLGLAQDLIRLLEERGEALNGYFVDLFVRRSNTVARGMYERMGYTLYRTVLNYYSGGPQEDALDYRKALSRDVEKKSIIPLPHPVTPEGIAD